MSYKTALKPSQVAYVDDIVSQIPTIAGARQAFVDILDQLAEAKPKYQFYVVALEDSTVLGTNNEATAGEFADSEIHAVIDTTSNMWLQIDGLEEEIEELRP